MSKTIENHPETSKNKEIPASEPDSNSGEKQNLLGYRLEFIKRKQTGYTKNWRPNQKVLKSDFLKDQINSFSIFSIETDQNK